MDGWDSFFLAQAGSAAALAGLLFVSVSISLDRILALPTLVDRALQALVMLMTVLIIASLCLVPDQPVTVLGAEILILGLVVWGVVLSLNLAVWRGYGPLRSVKMVVHVVLSQSTVTLYPVVGALLMLQGADAALWLVPAILLSFVVAFTDAWVLLVEIRR